ncbi:MAG: hypothetical protein U0T36_10310 [Saprospiraceae bacterium]
MKIKNIAVLSGNKTKVHDGVVHYVPEFKESKTNDGKPAKEIEQPAEIRTDINFYQGTISFKFKAASKETGVLLTWDKPNKGTEYAVGLSLQYKSFVIISNTTNEIATNGGLTQFKDNEEISVRFEMLGSDAKLFINNILYCEQNLNLTLAPLSFRITSDSEVFLSDIHVESIKPKLFVVMQFTDEFNALYKDVIFPVSEDAGYEVIRADEFFSSTPILNDIIRSIREASVIVADITPDNPNVFYEIGYAHAIQKPTILICDKKRQTSV